MGGTHHARVEVLVHPAEGVRCHLPFAGHEKGDVGDAQRIQGLRVGRPAVREEGAMGRGAARAQAGRATVRRVVNHLPARLGGILALVKDSSEEIGKMLNEMTEHGDINACNYNSGGHIFPVILLCTVDAGNFRNPI